MTEDEMVGWHHLLDGLAFAQASGVGEGQEACCAAVHGVWSVTQSCDPMDCSTPGFPVHHQLPELAQTHVHRVGDAIQPSHPLSSPSPPAFKDTYK